MEKKFSAHLYHGIFRLGKNPPTPNVEAFWQGGEGGSTMKKRDSQAHNATCAVGVTKSKVISWHGSKILGHNKNLKLSEKGSCQMRKFDLPVQFLKHGTSFK
jgi:hypothetical protein